MAKRGADVFAIELDAHWSEQRTSALSVGRVRVMRGDFLSVRLPVTMARPYANFVECHWPFGASTGR